MQRRKINALCIQEMKWTGQSARELGDGYKVFYSGNFVADPSPEGSKPA